MWIIRDREAGNSIELFATYEEAKAAVELFELEDKINDCYESDFYEIVEVWE